jgi:hypothetical protein
MVVRRSVARAADLTQECVIHLAVAGRLAEEGSEGRVERELACAERALSEAAEALASVAGVASPVGRARRVTGGSAGLRSVEDQVEAVARGLAALVVAVRRGAGSGRVREVAVAVGELRGQVAASRALWVRRTAA